MLKLVFRNTELYDQNQSNINVDFSWLQTLWKFITVTTARDKNYIAKLVGLPIVPVSQTKWEQLSDHRPYITVKCDNTYADEHLITALKKLGVIIIEHWDALDTVPNQTIMKKYITELSCAGTYDVLLKMDAEQIARSTSELTHNEKMALRKILHELKKGNASPKHKMFLNKLPLVECFAVLGNSSCNVWKQVKDVKFGLKKDFGVPMPQNVYIADLSTHDAKEFANLLQLESKEDAFIATKILMPEIAQYDKCQQEIMMINLFDYFDLYAKRNPEFKETVQKTAFISTGTDVKCPLEILDSGDTVLCGLFTGMKMFAAGTFADERYLSKLRINKMLKVVSSDDILKVAKYIDSQSIDVNESIFKQAEHLLDYLNRKTELIIPICDQLKTLKWIPSKPFELHQCTSWLPSHTEKIALVEPKNIFFKEAQDLIGCIRPVLSAGSIKKEVISLLAINTNPSVQEVCEQVKCITDAFNGKMPASQQQQGLESIMTKIYTYLSKYDIKEIICLKRETPNFIWTGERFVSVANVTHTLPGIIKVEPYMYALENTYQYIWQSFFWKMGVEKKAIEFVDILRMIKVYHDKECASTDEIKRDLNMCVQIINLLQDRAEHHYGDILLPVASDVNKLQLEPVSDCVYTDIEWLKKGNEDAMSEQCHVIHAQISPQTAAKLNVPSLMSKFIGAKSLNFSEDIAYGQSEPLTRRLKTILRDYTDGSAIITELLQNADDAKASTISFIYDTRSHNTSTRYLDPKMKELEGPSLLCYNDATFTESDFKNIVKLSGATKELETDKIGRYGLGFNAVYHLTDVPSFISDSSIVIFDPHMKYIGNLVNQPGIRLNMKTHGEKIKELRDQFITFQGLFGCDLQTKGTLEPFKGTLFQFPLRNNSQAEQSEISQKTYDEVEVSKLFQKLEHIGNDILLFTKHVKDIKVYTRTNSNGLVEVCNIKKSQNCSLNTEMSEIVEISSTFEKCKLFSVKQQRKQSNMWLICKQEGNPGDKICKQMSHSYIPVGAVAAMLRPEKNRKFSLKPLQYQNGQIFCFLPLPIKHELPVHINGYFCSNSEQNTTLCSKGF